MRDNILKYILIISLVLNFSFLGAAGYTHYKQTRYRCRLLLPGYGPSSGPGIRAVPSARIPSFRRVGVETGTVRSFPEKACPFTQPSQKKAAS